LLATTWWKEIRGQLRTGKAALWLIFTSVVFSFTCYLLLTDKELTLLDQAELLWLFGKIVLGAGLLIVTVDASLSLNAEFENETAETLFLTPLRPRTFVGGKLLASLTLWAAVYVVAVPYVVATAAGTGLAGAFLAYLGLWGTLAAGSFAMLTLALSLLYRSSRNTLTTAVVILLGLVIPASFPVTLKSNVLGRFLSGVNPIDNAFASLDNVLVDFKTSLGDNWRYLWPALIFALVGAAALAGATRQFRKQGVFRKG
jgi:ABC-type transport system involved in multi-copper enzyme maturation permease subunit